MRKNHLSALRKLFLASLLPLLLSCSTSDTTLRESGRSDAYIAGFHDGRRSGMNEAGNYLTRPTKDTRRFADDADYWAGWIAGEREGIHMQNAANVGVGAAGGANVYREAEKAQPNAQAIGNEVMKDVDTSSLKSLEPR